MDETRCVFQLALQSIQTGAHPCVCVCCRAVSTTSYERHADTLPARTSHLPAHTDSQPHSLQHAEKRLTKQGICTYRARNRNKPCTQEKHVRRSLHLSIANQQLVIRLSRNRSAVTIRHVKHQQSVCAHMAIPLSTDWSHPSLLTG